MANIQTKTSIITRFLRTSQASSKQYNFCCDFKQSITMNNSVYNIVLYQMESSKSLAAHVIYHEKLRTLVTDPPPLTRWRFKIRSSNTLETGVTKSVGTTLQFSFFLSFFFLLEIFCFVIFTATCWCTQCSCIYAVNNTFMKTYLLQVVQYKKQHLGTWQELQMHWSSYQCPIYGPRQLDVMKSRNLKTQNLMC